MTTTMAGWGLFEDLRAAQDELLRAMRGRGWQPGQQYYSDAGAAAWAPPVDISERKDAYLVTAELPGVKAGEVAITVEDGPLTIQGERHLAHDSAEEKMHPTERSYGAYRRSNTLPSHVEADSTLVMSVRWSCCASLTARPRSPELAALTVSAGAALTAPLNAARKHQPWPERCRPGAALRVPGARLAGARRRSSQDSLRASAGLPAGRG